MWPLAMVGALGRLLAAGQTLNLFSRIGIIVLFGLITKNPIVLIDDGAALANAGLRRLTGRTPSATAGREEGWTPGLATEERGSGPQGGAGHRTGQCRPLEGAGLNPWPKLADASFGAVRVAVVEPR